MAMEKRKRRRQGRLWIEAERLAKGRAHPFYRRLNKVLDVEGFDSMEEFCAREEIPVPPLRSEALAVLMAHDFPCNVRELQNLVEGAVSLAEGEVDADLLRSLIGSSASTGPEALDLETVERRHIRRVMELTDGNKMAAARILGVNRKTLQRKGF